MDYLKKIQNSQEQIQNNRQNKENSIFRNHKTNFHLAKSNKNSINANNRRSSQRPTNKVNKNVLLYYDFKNILKFNNEILSKAFSCTESNGDIKNMLNKNKEVSSLKKNINNSNLNKRNNLCSLKYDEGESKTISKILSRKNLYYGKKNNYQTIKAKTIKKPTLTTSFKKRILNIDKNNSKYFLKSKSNLHRLNSATIDPNANRNNYLKLYENSSSNKSILDKYYSDKNNENKNTLNNNYDQRNKNLIFNSTAYNFIKKRHFYRTKILLIETSISDYYKIKNNKYNFFNNPLITKEYFTTSKTKDSNSIERFLKKKIISNCNKIKYNKTFYKKQKINLNNKLLSQINNSETRKFPQHEEFLTDNSDDSKKSIVYKPIKIDIKNKILLNEKIKNLDNEKDEACQIMSNTFREKNRCANAQKYSLITK